MKNQKSFFSIFTILFSLALLSSCSTSNEVVSNNFITKRKYNKGFHIDFKKRYNSEKEADLAINDLKKKQFTLEESDVTENKDLQEDVTTVSNEIIVNQEENIKSDVAFNDVNFNSSENSNSFLSNENTFIEANKVIKNSSDNKIQKVKSIENKKNSFKNVSKRASEETILLVILCFILSPLAVFLHQGTWNTKCWINLLLFVLFIFPGLLHGLYVILVD